MTVPWCQRLHPPVLLLVLSVAANAAIARTPPPSPLQRACAADIEERIELRFADGRHVSACAPGVGDGCAYGSGQTTLDATPDLNNDGRADAILTHFGSSYGDIDVTHKLVLAQCPDGTYARLLEGRFTTLAAPPAPHPAWPALEASRDCPGGRETIALHFERAAARYRGPEHFDPDNACTR
ncbi:MULTISPECIES: hypothetical protein [Stenotrophomonas]|uniref:Secreted protein n=1 Tax=Stenotrophomonas maltophilia TaxID=40324 RepID=A0AAI9C4H8_STEMA|nr:MULTISPECIES: hypothetical protein [Stenotrophomonas]UUS14094.1 hypothetical protein NMB32_19940 [Stenotrophomonas sp. CD2]AWT15248.1 hypothetical protein DM611_13685 [Stenotrophomonas maltophilia]EKT4093830.1 hypothetical protein [Stenotrophomonas maltophilia]MBA0361841.1 hypothetical protein [Stenotrophomonas maltophilia]MBA0430403.1 hypothetical protein [Stenotrophomonas maltophilia]